MLLQPVQQVLPLLLQLLFHLPLLQFPLPLLQPLLLLVLQQQPVHSRRG